MIILIFFGFKFKQFLFYRFAHGNENDSFKMFEEKFLRKTIQNFPYKQCPLLQQLVRLIAPITLVNILDPKIFGINSLFFRVKIHPL